jgi:hypothetical protein
LQKSFTPWCFKESVSILRLVLDFPDAAHFDPVGTASLGLAFSDGAGPSERYHEERNMRHKTITDWAWQMLLQVARWMPGRNLIVVADGTYAVLEFLLNVSRLPCVSAITRLGCVAKNHQGMQRSECLPSCSA